MANKRYTVRDKIVEVADGAKTRQVKVWYVWDGQRGRIADGTRTGGYPNKSDAKGIADRRNKTEADMRADRDKRK